MYTQPPRTPPRHDDTPSSSVPTLEVSCHPSLRQPPEHLEAARADILAFTGFPKDLWAQI